MLRVRVRLSGWLLPPTPILPKLLFETPSDSMYRNKIAHSDLVQVQICNTNSPGGLFNGGKK